MSQPGKPADWDRSEWTMSEERALLEKIVYHRFNFFMVLVTVISATTIRADSLITLRLSLGTGLGLAILFFLSIWKNEARLNAATRCLQEIPEHPVAILDRVVGGISSKGVLGYLIPITCIVILVVANILAWVLPR